MLMKVRLDHYSIENRNESSRPAENRQFPTFSIIKVAQIATRQKHIRYLEIASRQKLYYERQYRLRLLGRAGPS